MTTNNLWIRKFDRDREFLVRRGPLTIAGRTFKAGEPFDKTLVTTRRLRQMFDKRDLYFSDDKDKFVVRHSTLMSLRHKTPGQSTQGDIQVDPPIDQENAQNDPLSNLNDILALNPVVSILSDSGLHQGKVKVQKIEIVEDPETGEASIAMTCELPKREQQVEKPAENSEETQEITETDTPLEDEFEAPEETQEAAKTADETQEEPAQEETASNETSTEDTESVENAEDTESEAEDAVSSDTEVKDEAADEIDEGSGDPAPGEDIESLREQAKALGIDVDARWRERRLKAEIAKVQG